MKHFLLRNVATDALACFTSWEPDACIVSNIKSVDLAHMAQYVLDHTEDPGTGRGCCDRATTYWRRCYQQEASENTLIREALGVSTDDSDATLPATAVTDLINRHDALRRELTDLCDFAEKGVGREPVIKTSTLRATLAAHRDRLK